MTGTGHIPTLLPEQTGLAYGHAERRYTTDMNKEEYVYIGNLPFSTTEEVLKDTFSDFPIQEIIMMMNDDGHFAGVAIIHMESVEEAQKAVALLRGKKMGDREMDVTLYSKVL